jgi:hypothetical protein
MKWNVDGGQETDMPVEVAAITLMASVDLVYAVHETKDTA